MGQQQIFEYQEVERLSEVNALAREGWRLVTAYSMTFLNHSDEITSDCTYVMEREVQPTSASDAT